MANPIKFAALLMVGFASCATSKADPEAWIHASTMGNYAYSATDETSQNAFNLNRAEISAGAREAGIGGGVLTVEAVRSATPESLFGIDGNSLLLRVKHGFAFVDPTFDPVQLTVAAGMIPDVWIESLEERYRLRSMRVTLSESAGFFDTSDLGARLGAVAFDGLLEARLSLTNGEGRNQVELNDGKNLSAVLSARPLKFRVFDEDATLAIHAMVRDGSLGQGVARNHRYGGAIGLHHPNLGMGVEAVLADGFEGRSNSAPWALGAWMETHVFKDILGVWGSFDHLVIDSEVEGADSTSFAFGIFGDLVNMAHPSWRSTEMQPGVQALRVGLNYKQTIFGDAGGSVSGAPEISNIHSISATFDAAGLLF